MHRSTLTSEQLGHLRHFDNLSRLQINDWSGMNSRVNGQDGFNAYRYQLAYMIYALALTHVHRLPAAPGLFQPTIRRLIDKLLLPETWMYWRDTSRGGAAWNAHIPMEEEWDPVARDNIMYSAYVQSAASLHDYLFGSDHYARPGSIEFRFWSMHWGGEEKRFPYDRDSLNDHIYWLLVQNGYLGVACEPNCIFQICIHPAILGFRMHDFIDGGHRADDVIASYRKAWEGYPRVDENGHFTVAITQDTHDLVTNRNRVAFSDGWLGSLMNMWNSDLVRERYPAQLALHLRHSVSGTLSVKPGHVHEVNGENMAGEADISFGWLTAWASEMGDEQTLAGLLAHADRYMRPTWSDGGLHYPRNDQSVDDAGNLTEMGPMAGNVLLGYARLNVRDGLQRLFTERLDDIRFEQPAVVEVARDVELSRAEVVGGALHVTLRRDPRLPGEGEIAIARLVGRGSWRVMVDGVEVGAVADGVTDIDLPDSLRIVRRGDLLQVAATERWTDLAVVPMR